MSTDRTISPTQLPFIVLAGERPGGSALAQAMQVAAGVLVPVAGQTALARVFAALRASPSLATGILCGPTETIVRHSEELQRLLEPGDIRWLAPAAGPAASTLAALTALRRYPCLLTTGDHALLTPAIVEEFLGKALSADADILVGLVPYPRVIAAYPGTRRTALRFQDQAYCGSNLFLLRGAEGLRAVQFWRQVESLRKRPWRIARQLGLWTLLRYLAGWLPVASAMALLSERAACRVGFVELDEPRAAVDVDSLADRELAESILQG